MNVAVETETYEQYSTPLAPDAVKMESKDLDFFYGKNRALHSVSLQVMNKGVTALIGPSGCGKSTLLRVFNRIYALYPGQRAEGEVVLDGQNILDRKVDVATLRSRVGMVFQKPTPFPMSIFDNVAFALREQSRKRPRRRELEPLVIDALRRAGLYEEVHDDLDRPALRLSGGQQQRLCIARALAVRPKVLLMDEPCSALDPISTSVIESTIRELCHELTIVIVTHNMQQAQRVSDTCALFLVDSEGAPGHIVEAGPTQQVFDSPRDPRTSDYVHGRFG